MVADQTVAAEEVLVVAELTLVEAETGRIVAHGLEAGQTRAAAVVGDHLARITREAAARLAGAPVAFGAFAAVVIALAGFAFDAAGYGAEAINAGKTVATGGRVFASRTLSCAVLRADAAQANQSD